MCKQIDRVIVIALLGVFLVGPALGAGHPPASPARLKSRPISLPAHRVLQQALFAAPRDTLACFESPLGVLLNPACFITDTRPGDCVSASSDFLVQYLFPDYAGRVRVDSLAFLNNDAATVFPSAGVLQLPIDSQGNVRFPTPTELANLQVQQIHASADTSVLWVDLRPQNIIVEPGANTALVVALQFPQGGDLSAVGVGPGIAADDVLPDQACDLFTVDGGNTWFEPAPCTDPSCVPLDWGFVLLLSPTTPIELITWSHVKALYRTP